MSEKDPQVLVRMASELKAELMKRAEANGRSMTSEINTRLRDSLAKDQVETAKAIQSALDGDFPASQFMEVRHVNDREVSNPHPPRDPRSLNTENVDFSALENQMVKLFRRLPFDKQLSLLSLLH